MIAQVQQADGTFVDEEREPVCDLDLCDQCGDCLACWGDTVECYALFSGRGCQYGPVVRHVFVIYLEN